MAKSRPNRSKRFISRGPPRNDSARSKRYLHSISEDLFMTKTDKSRREFLRKTAAAVGAVGAVTIVGKPRWALSPAVAFTNWGSLSGATSPITPVPFATREPAAFPRTSLHAGAWDVTCDYPNGVKTAIHGLPHRKVRRHALPSELASRRRRDLSWERGLDQRCRRLSPAINRYGR